MEIKTTCESCPYQLEGTLDDGRAFYFRSRHDRWRLHVGAAGDEWGLLDHRNIVAEGDFEPQYMWEFLRILADYLESEHLKIHIEKTEAIVRGGNR